MEMKSIIKGNKASGSKCVGKCVAKVSCNQPPTKLNSKLMKVESIIIASHKYQYLSNSLKVVLYHFKLSFNVRLFGLGGETAASDGVSVISSIRKHKSFNGARARG